MRRRWRISVIKIRFIGLVARVLRERACERVLVPFLQQRRLGVCVVAELLAWCQCRDRQERGRRDLVKVFYGKEPVYVGE